MEVCTRGRELAPCLLGRRLSTALRTIDIGWNERRGSHDLLHGVVVIILGSTLASTRILAEARRAWRFLYIRLTWVHVSMHGCIACSLLSAQTLPTSLCRRYRSKATRSWCLTSTCQHWQQSSRLAGPWRLIWPHRWMPSRLLLAHRWFPCYFRDYDRCLRELLHAFKQFLSFLFFFVPLGNVERGLSFL